MTTITDPTPSPIRMPDRSGRAASYRLVPIAASVADELRAVGGPVSIATAKPGYPCRQCLRDAEIGEALVLVSHDPFAASGYVDGTETSSAYRGPSPIFLHVESCAPPTTTTGPDLPEQLTLRQLSVRAFDQRAAMIDAAVIDGAVLHETLERMFAAEETHAVHVHNAVRGCWAVSAVRR